MEKADQDYATLRLFLKSKDFVDVLDAVLDVKTVKAEKKADCGARNYIVSNLSDLQFAVVCYETSAKGMIGILDYVYDQKDES